MAWLWEAGEIESFESPANKLHGANMGPIWDRQDPCGPHVGPTNFAIWEARYELYHDLELPSYGIKMQTSLVSHFTPVNSVTCGAPHANTILYLCQFQTMRLLCKSTPFSTNGRINNDDGKYKWEKWFKFDVWYVQKTMAYRLSSLD